MHAATEKAIAEVQKYVRLNQKLKEAQGAEKDALLEDEDTMDMFAFGLARVFSTHAVELAKARLLTITGDESHMSVSYKTKLMQNIDKPRKYDFQPENHSEEEVIRMLKHFGMPEYDMRLADRTKLTPERAIAALKGEEAITVQLGYNGTCYDCGDKLLVTINGTNLHYTAVKGKCESNAIFEVEIDFPTGVVVFGDWPDRFSEFAAAGMLPTKSFDVNTLLGCRQTSDGYVPYQVFHHSVGNTSPSWFYNKDTKEIQIGSAYNEGTEENDWEDEGHITPEGFEDMGSFCTDLWWVTMLDKQYYDEMLALLPGERDESFYEKDVETATIEPGRYRFTAYARSEDESVFAKAVRIGECSGVPPKRDNMVGRRIVTPMELASVRAMRSYGKHITEAAAQASVRGTLDSIFNVIGNGIRNKSEFLDHISIGPDEEVPKFAEPDGKEHNYEPNYYPNFKRNYSTIYQMDMADIPTVWLEAAEGFYVEALDYFKNGAANYSYAYPSKRAKDDEDFKNRIDEYRKEGMSDADWYEAVSKAYEVEFNGCFYTFATLRWEKEKARCIDFITTALSDIRDELAERE